MLATFPVYRRGKLIESGHQIAEATADRIAELVLENGAKYEDAVITALQAEGGYECVARTNEKVERRSDSKRIFNFPAIDCRDGRFAIHLRGSLTVCVGTRRSKIWVWMVCEDVEGQGNQALDVETVQVFFERAEVLSEQVLRALFAAYRTDLATEGIAVPEEPAYTFCFRAFNTRDETVEELYHSVSDALPLTKALHQERYAPVLQSFFQVVGDRRTPPTSEKIEEDLRLGVLDAFGYHSPRHNALFVARTDSSVTDLCGFGFDAGDQYNKTMAFQATSSLLEEYARRF